MGFPRLYAIVDRATLDARGVGVDEFARELREAGVRLVQYRDKVNGLQEILRAAREIDAAFEGAEVVRVMNDRADLAVLARWEGVHVGQGDLAVEAVRKVLGDRAGGEESRFLAVLGMTERKASAKANATATARAKATAEACAKATATTTARAKANATATARAKATATAEARATERATAKTFVVGVSTHSEEQVRVAVEPTSQDRDVGHPGSLPDYVAVGPVFGTATKANAEPVVGLEFVRRARAMTELPIVAIGGITLGNARSVIEAGADAVAVIGGLFVEGRRVREVARDFLDVLG